MAFGQALREFRKQRKVSQERLAELGEFDRSYVSLVERGLRSPTVRSVFKLARVLDVNPGAIMGRAHEILEDWRRHPPKRRPKRRSA